MDNLLDHVCSSTAPFIVLVKGVDGGEDVSAFPFEIGELPAGFVCRLLRGKAMGTVAGLMYEFSTVLQFPSKVRRSWDALDERLTDMEWLPGTGYLLLINHPLKVLEHDSASFSTLMRILEAAGREWSQAISEGAHWDRPPVPFHFLLGESSSNFEALIHRVGGTGVQFGQWRLD